MRSVSVILLTRERPEKLLASLERLRGQLGPQDEVLVLDTGSSPSVLTRVAEALRPRERLERFPGPGSWAEARNRGVQLARGEALAFLDDDCYAAEDWIDRGRSGLDERDAVGGWVEPLPGLAWPDWWSPEMGWLIGLSVPGHRGPDAGRVYYPYTANLWVRAEVARAEPFQELGGTFAAEEGERYRLGREDAEWWKRLRRRGYRTLFDPALRVEHDIDPTRLRLSYLFERARRDGEAWARREGGPDDLEPLAYQWWVHAAPDPSDGLGSGRGRAGGRWHALMRARHRAALRALARKIAETSDGRESPSRLWVGALARAGMARLRDRSKTTARRLWLAVDAPRRIAPRTAPPDRPAVAAFGFVGDLVILQACLRGVQGARPGPALSLIAPSTARPIFHGLDRIDLETVPEGIDPLSAAGRDVLLGWVRRTGPELIVAPYLHGHWGTALARLGRRGAPIVGFDRDEGLRRQMDRERLALRIEKDLTRPELDNVRRLLAAAGVRVEPQPPELAPLPEAIDRVRAWRATWPAAAGAGPFLVLNPEAGHPQKEWPATAWGELARRLRESLPQALVFNSRRAHPEVEAAVREVVADEAGILWFREGPLEDLIALIALSEGVITVDAGPQHLAHGLGRPSLTLYGPMDERRWADPWRRPIHRTIRGGMFDLTPEELRGLPVNHLMRLLRPEKVAEAALAWAAECLGEGAPPWGFIPGQPL